MNFFQLIEKIKPVFLDETLCDWCRAELGVLPRILIGVNESDPPRREDYPLIALTEIRPGVGSPPGRNVFEMDLACGVVDERILYDPDNDRLQTYAGFLLAEQMRAILTAALRRAPLSKCVVADAGALGVHPMYISGMTVSIEVIATGRR